MLIVKKKTHSNISTHQFSGFGKHLLCGVLALLVVLVKRQVQQNAVAANAQKDIAQRRQKVMKRARLHLLSGERKGKVAKRVFPTQSKRNHS